MQRTVLAFGAIYDQEGFELTHEEVQQELKARSAFLAFPFLVKVRPLSGWRMTPAWKLAKMWLPL